MKQSVLIIDDDPDIGELISQAAQTFGHDCTPTSDVASFWASLSPTTAIVFLDLVMPDVDGIQILRQLALQKSRAALILMSGVGSRVLNSAVELAKDSNLQILGSLQKPFGMKQVEGLFEKPLVGLSVENSNLQDLDALESSEIQRALERDEFCLHYQPRLKVIDACVVGIVGVARWNHSTKGILLPDQFIPQIERLGLITPFAWREIDQALSDLARNDWRWRGETISVSIKVSIHTLMDFTFPDQLQAHMANYNVSPDRLTIHIIEGGLLAELFGVVDVLIRLRLKGIQISINDFGMGCSMKRHLRKLPATEIRIDKAFVRGMSCNPNDKEVVRKSVQVGHELGMKVVAHGVEETVQFEELCKMSCDIAVGTLFARPMSNEVFNVWLKQ